MSILDEMKVRRLYCDGGMGSLLQAAGLAARALEYFPSGSYYRCAQKIPGSRCGYYDYQYLWRQPVKI